MGVDSCGANESLELAVPWNLHRQSGSCKLHSVDGQWLNFTGTR